jgi:hypothetical protein
MGRDYKSKEIKKEEEGREEKLTEVKKRGEMGWDGMGFD